jgi:SAM dependent carboxyl methyltransferase
VRIAHGMYFSEARGSAREALAAQAAGDWAAFLEARAAELAQGGRLLVQGIGTARSDGGSEHVSAGRLLRVMWQVAADLAEAGLLDRRVLEDYVFPVYCRSPDEATAPVREGGHLADAFEVASIEVDEVSNPYWEAYERDGDAQAYAAAYVQFVRAFAESTLTEHLLEPGAVSTEPATLCDEYFRRMQVATSADPEAGRYEAWVVRVVLARR